MLNSQATNTLIKEFKGSPEAKFFLVKFLSAFPNGTDHVRDLSVFSKGLGFTVPVASRCISELVELDMLSEQRHKPGQKPFRILHVSQLPEGTNIDSQKANVIHHRHMEQLLVWGEEPLRERRHQLTINKRLVLLFLTAHADKAGIVRGLGSPEIGRCTGLKVSQVRNSIRLLIRHHYIAFSVPGGNFPGSMGKITSTYVLNLRHLNFGYELLPGFTCLLDFHGSYGYSRHEAAKFCRLLIHLQDETQRAKASTSKKLLDHVQKNPCYLFTQYGKVKITRGLENRMQWELQDIASIVLNGVRINKISLPKIKVLIRRRVFGQIMKDSTLSKEERARILNPVLQILSKSVEEIVSRTRRILLQLLPFDPVEAATIQILPKQRSDCSNETSTIEITGNDQSKNDHQVLIATLDFESSRVLKTAKADPLNELPFKTLKSFSLATPPIVPPKLRAPPKTRGPKRLQ